MIDEITTRDPTTDITILGDLNTDILNLTRQFYHFLVENNLHTTIITPTRHDPVHIDTATAIDVTLTTITNVNITAGTILPPITDHMPTNTIFHTPTTRTTTTHKTLSMTRYERHKDKILQDTQDSITAAIRDTKRHRTDSTSDMLQDIQTAIRTTIEKYEGIPKKNPRYNHWITPKYKRQIKRQRQLYRKKIHTPTQQNIDTYKKYKNRLTKAIRTDKRRALLAEIEDTRTDPKKRAQVINKVIPKRSTTRTSPTKITYNNKTYTDPQDIANALNDHYIKIGHKTALSIPDYEDNHEHDDQKQNNDTKF